MKTKIVLFLFFINAAYFNSLNASNFNATFFFSELFNPIDSIDYKINILLKKIITGKGQMYEVEQAHAESYTVNDEHILTLHMPDHKVIFWNSTKKSWSTLWWNNEKREIKTTIKPPNSPPKWA